jgi:hypothetical protein
LSESSRSTARLPLWVLLSVFRADGGLIHKIGPGVYATTTWSPNDLQWNGDR